MYIRTYENDILSSPVMSPRRRHDHQNLASTTTEGINLHKLMMRKSLSKNERSPTKLDYNQQPKILPEFYKSNCFGASLKNNRIREIKSRRKMKERVPDKVKEELMNIIEQNVLRFAKNRSISNKKAKNKKNLELQFSVSGRPMSRDMKSFDNIPTPEHINKFNQTVLDFSKLNNHNFRVSQEKQQKLNQNFIDFSRRTKKWQPSLDSLGEGEPQILIDYRRSMSSGRKRNLHNELTNPTEESKKKRQDMILHGQKINPWAVRRFQQEQQLFF